MDKYIQWLIDMRVLHGATVNCIESVLESDDSDAEKLESIARFIKRNKEKRYGVNDI